MAANGDIMGWFKNAVNQTYADALVKVARERGLRTVDGIDITDDAEPGTVDWDLVRRLANERLAEEPE